MMLKLEFPKLVYLLNDLIKGAVIYVFTLLQSLLHEILMSTPIACFCLWHHQESIF